MIQDSDLLLLPLLLWEAHRGNYRSMLLSYLPAKGLSSGKLHPRREHLGTCSVHSCIGTQVLSRAETRAFPNRALFKCSQWNCCRLWPVWLRSEVCSVLSGLGIKGWRCLRACWWLPRHPHVSLGSSADPHAGVPRGVRISPLKGGSPKAWFHSYVTFCAV